MFVSSIARRDVRDRLDPAFYAPLPIKADRWLAARGRARVTELSRLVRFHASAFYEGIAARYERDGVPFVRVADVQSGSITTAGAAHVPEAVATGTAGLTTVEHPFIAITKGGSVGRVGTSVTEGVHALSRDVIGLAPVNPGDVGLVLFFLASAPGRAQVLRGASRQVQAHLTLDRLRDVRIPAVAEADRDRLRDAADAVSGARRLFDSLRKQLDGELRSVDPFARLDEPSLSYSIDRSDVLRARMDPGFYRPGFAAAHAAAVEDGWTRLGQTEWLSWPEDRWERAGLPPSEFLEYVPLGAIERLSCRIVRPSRVRVWAAPTRATWLVQADDVLIPSLLDCLDRVGLVSARDAGAVCSSGFYVARPSTPDYGLFMAAYLSSVGAQTQIARAGSGTRFRGITPERIAAVLVPPVKRVANLAGLMRNVQSAAASLQAAWDDGVNLVQDVVGWSGPRTGFLETEDVIEDGEVGEPA